MGAGIPGGHIQLHRVEALIGILCILLKDKIKGSETPKYSVTERMCLGFTNCIAIGHLYYSVDYCVVKIMKLINFKCRSVSENVMIRYEPRRHNISNFMMK